MADNTSPKGNARQSAIYLLDQIIGEGRLMSELLSAGVLDRLDPPARAAAQRLANDTLRGIERADRLLQHHLRKSPPLTVHNALRLGTVELANGGDAHGVVNELVNIVGRNKHTGALKGLVNAVLRKMTTEASEAWPTLRAPRLPKWLRNPLVEAYDGEIMAAVDLAHLAGAPLDITAKTDPEALAKTLSGTLLPTGTVRLKAGVQVSALPGFEAGDWWVQDAAAALPARLLNAQKGEKVLDLCAAPGGKTMQLAATGADVTALDISGARMARVEENLTRTKLTAKLLTEDVFHHEGGPYDAILLDAPCSATGTIRRHPDLPHAKTGSEIGELIGLQEAMIDHALSLLKPGGRLVFATCSLLPDEGECQVDDALERHAGLRVDASALVLDGIDPAWHSSEGGLRLRPDFWADQGGMDGFYMAVLRT